MDIQTIKEELTFARALANVNSGDIHYVKEQLEILLSDCEDLEDALDYCEDMAHDLESDGVEIEEEVFARLLIALAEGEWV